MVFFLWLWTFGIALGGARGAIYVVTKKLNTTNSPTYFHLMFYGGAYALGWFVTYLLGLAAIVRIGS